MAAKSGELVHGKPGSGTYYPAFPVLGLASDGQDIFMMGGGGGATAAKEVPNVVQAYRYDNATDKLSLVAKLDTGKEVVVYLSHAGSGPATGQWLASVRDRTKILFLDTSTDSIMELCEWATEKDGKDPSQNVAKYAPGGRLIATGGTDGIVRIYTAATPPALPRLSRELTKYQEVQDLEFNGDGSILASCDRTGFCRIWDPRTGDEKTSFKYEVKGQKAPLLIRAVRFMTVPAKGGMVSYQLVVSASGPRGPAYLGIFTLEGKKLRETLMDQKPTTSLALDSQHRYAAVCVTTGAKKIYSLPNLKVLKTVKGAHELPAPSCAFVCDSVAVSGSGDRSLNVLRAVKRDAGGGGSFCGRFCSVLIAALLIPVVALVATILDEPTVITLGQPGAGEGRGAASVSDSGMNVGTASGPVPRAVRSLYDRVAFAYDKANVFMSLGMDGHWRQQVIEECLTLERDDRVLDLAAGTADVALLAGRRLKELHVGSVPASGDGGAVLGVDISPEMLRHGAGKVEEQDLGGFVRFVQGDAQDLSEVRTIDAAGALSQKSPGIADETVDKISMAYAIRHMPDRAKSLREIRRVLRTGASSRVCILEYSLPVGDSPVARYLRAFIEDYVAPFVAKVATLGSVEGSGEEEYNSMVRSIVAFPNPLSFAADMAKEGLPVHRITSFAFGSVQLYAAAPAIIQINA